MSNWFVSKKTTCWVGFVITIIFILLPALPIFKASSDSMPIFSATSAYAKSYTVDKVDINAQLTAQGSLKVVETRNFSFSGNFSALWWDFGTLPVGAAIRVSKVEIAVKGASPLEIVSVPFETRWRKAGGPGQSAYSYDQEKNTAWVFHNIHSQDLKVTIAYEISNFAQLYRDTGELYWKFVGSGWGVDSNNVSINLTMPANINEQVKVGENLRVFAHGALDGQISANLHGKVTASVPVVKAGTFAEVRVLFPTTWLSTVPAQYVQKHDTNRISQVLEEERVWAEQANQIRTNAKTEIYIVLGIGLLLVLINLYLFFKFGREYRTSFQDEYWREHPDPELSPLQAVYIYEWGEIERNEFFAAQILELVQRKVFTIKTLDPDRVKAQSGQIRGVINRVMSLFKDSGPQYALLLNPQWEQIVGDNSVQRKAVKLLHETVGEGKDEILFADLMDKAQSDPEEVSQAFASWEKAIRISTRKITDLDEPKSFYARGFTIASMVIMGLLLFFWANQTFMWGLSIPIFVALLILMMYMPRRTKRANEVYAKTKALCNWLTEFSALNERPPTDVQVWDYLMVYAVALGVAEEAIEALKVRVPEVVEAPQFATTRGMLFVQDNSFSPISSLHSNLDAADSTIEAATSSSSSSSGSGGGFSSGGGGGFGGGGGGAR